MSRYCPYCGNKITEKDFRFQPGEKAKIYASVIDCLLQGDGIGVQEIMEEYKEVEARIAFWTLFSSRERAAIKVFTNEFGDNHD